MILFRMTIISICIILTAGHYQAKAAMSSQNMCVHGNSGQVNPYKIMDGTVFISGGFLEANVYENWITKPGWIQYNVPTFSNKNSSKMNNIEVKVECIKRGTIKRIDVYTGNERIAAEDDLQVECDGGTEIYDISFTPEYFKDGFGVSILPAYNKDSYVTYDNNEHGAVRIISVCAQSAYSPYPH